MKIIVVCENNKRLSNIYAALGDIEASPIVLHASDCADATRTLRRIEDVGLIMIDADLACGTQVNEFRRLRLQAQAVPFLMTSDFTDRKHICTVVEEVRSQALLSSPAAQAFLHALLGNFPAARHERPSDDASASRDEHDTDPSGWAKSTPFAVARSAAVTPTIEELVEFDAANTESTDIGSADMSLTERQREVLSLLCDGKSNKEIGNALDISEATVKVHCRAIFRELGVRSRMAAAAAVNRLA